MTCVACKMAAISALQAYGSDSENSDNDSDSGTVQTAKPDDVAHLKPLEDGRKLPALKTVAKINAAPDVITKDDVNLVKPVDLGTTKEVAYNPTYDQLFAPQIGPVNPFKTQQDQAHKNTLSGFVEEAHVNDFTFEVQRRTFHSYGYAVDPSHDPAGIKTQIIGDKEAADVNKAVTVFEAKKARPSDKRKRVRATEPEDIEGFQGPWGGYVDEKTVAKPSEEEQKELDEIIAKRQKKGKKEEEKSAEEKTQLHVKDMYDYQGRSYLHPPQDLEVNLRSDEPPEKCFIPKKHIHSWSGHSKGVSCIRLFPKSGHLLLSSSMDNKIKIWEVYNKRSMVRTYIGHKHAVRDVCFNNDGTQFLSAAYDRYIKLWDTETGACISRFTNRKVPYCAKFNPDEDKQHIFVAGMSDKKIVQWDTRSGEIVQEYDRHLGAVNTITFVDENRRFVTTSDDKSLRVWEWDIPVDFKYIAEPGMHSMPAVTLSPNGKWLGCQSMDNKIVIYGAHNRFRLNRKKEFKGHMVAGYACQMDFSPDMSYVVSGDADGKLFIWDWKSTKLYSKIKAHDGVCISCLWLPHETSKVITAGWDGLIKLWD
ncbi:pre-mRNA-processing factor 17-like isoform X2 [Branchiostoma lanceolatum]|uniref:pre-mRNA-processing factor 17-like isoform X2 n=1 Tax=Branchiostoma lanceolatum TaxID=7740 RepID=UPI00345156BB